jgi:hypothetical protein
MQTCSITMQVGLKTGVLTTVRFSSRWLHSPEAGKRRNRLAKIWRYLETIQRHRGRLAAALLTHSVSAFHLHIYNISLEGTDRSTHGIALWTHIDNQSDRTKLQRTGTELYLHVVLRNGRRDQRRTPCLQLAHTGTAAVGTEAGLPVNYRRPQMR